MRKDQCKLCTSKSCYFRIHSVTEGYNYDEVACRRHSRDLEIDADNVLGRNNGVVREHISSTGKLYRGMPVR